MKDFYLREDHKEEIPKVMILDKVGRLENSSLSKVNPKDRAERQKSECWTISEKIENRNKTHVIDDPEDRK